MVPRQEFQALQSESAGILAGLLAMAVFERAIAHEGSVSLGRRPPKQVDDPAGRLSVSAGERFRRYCANGFSLSRRASASLAISVSKNCSGATLFSM